MQSVILGTAQWGLDYGVTNTTGRLADPDLDLLIVAAGQVGITQLDTAPAYGDAEARIGRHALGFSVQTKVTGSGRSATEIVASVEGSLRRLGATALAAVLVHDWPTLSAADQHTCATALEALRESGIIEAVGVSGYGEDDLRSARAAFGRLDIAQLPVSVLDQRLDRSEVVAVLRSEGTRIQARSVFLQGVALSHDEGTAFGRHDDVVRLRAEALRTRASLPSVCLGYVRSRPWVDEVVLAATSESELSQIWQAWTGEIPAIGWSALASSDPGLIDPRRWPARPSEG